MPKGDPSIQALLEQNDVPELADEPGPGHYFGPESANFSSIGLQRLARNRSEPIVTLPRTGWRDWERVRISAVHSKATIGQDSPGAAYDVTGQLCQKGAKIGTSTRPPLSHIDPFASPGPAYNVREAPGQCIGYGVCEPKGRLKKGFGVANRFRDRNGNKLNLGPGEYNRKDVSLNVNTGRSIGCGREAWEKVITPGWETEGKCRTSPGPGPPLWTSINNTGSRFGTANRFGKDVLDKSPGPGSYKRAERDVSNKRQHISDTRNPQQICFGSKPTKPRFRPALALRCANAGWGYF